MSPVTIEFCPTKGRWTLEEATGFLSPEGLCRLTRLRGKYLEGSRWLVQEFLNSGFSF